MPAPTTVADRTIAATIYLTCLAAGVLAGHPLGPTAALAALLSGAWYAWMRGLRARTFDGRGPSNV